MEKSQLLMQVPDGNYTVSWTSTLSGETIRTEEVSSKNGHLILTVPFEDGEIAIKIEVLEE
jgi:hypothetical protein